jgi:hypothetical protein
LGAGLGKGSQVLRKARDGAVIQSRPPAPAPTLQQAQAQPSPTGKAGSIPENAAYPRRGK